MRLLDVKAPIPFFKITNDIQLATEIQARLIDLGYLDPPADGRFGAFSEFGLDAFQSSIKSTDTVLTPKLASDILRTQKASLLKLDNSLASRVIRYMLKNNQFVAIARGYFNIAYVEGIDKDGKVNGDRHNEWNDRRMVIEIVDGVPTFRGNWIATTEPGKYYTDRPMNPQGAARIAFGQYRAWRVGVHGNSEPHEALVQTGEIKVHRDLNKDGYRTGDKVFSGLYGVNQHYGFDMAFVDRASAGCLVGQKRTEHREFMRIITSDRRYQLNNNYQFFTTIIPGDQLG